MHDKSAADEDTFSFDLPDVEELDEYGVWVKSGPQDLEFNDEFEVPTASEELDADVSEDGQDAGGEDIDYTESGESAIPTQDGDSVDNQDTEVDRMSDHENNDNLDQDQEISIEIPESDNDSFTTDADLQAQLDSIDFDNLDDGEITLDLSIDDDDDSEEEFLEEDELRLDLDDTMEDIMLDDFSSSDEDDVNDLIIPGFDDIDLETPSNPSAESAEYNPAPPAGETEDELPPEVESGDSGTQSAVEIPLEEPPSAEPSGIQLEQETAEIDFGDTMAMEESEESIEIDETSFGDGPTEENELTIGSLPDLDDDFLDIGDESIDIEAYAKDSANSNVDGDDEVDTSEDQSLEIADLPIDDTLPGSEEDGLSLDDIHEPDYTETLPELEDFDDIEAVSDEFSDTNSAFSDDGGEAPISVIGVPEEAEEETETPSSVSEPRVTVDAGSSILSAIEHELSAIKSELTSLRQELSGLRMQERELRDSLSKTAADQPVAVPTEEAAVFTEPEPIAEPQVEAESIFAEPDTEESSAESEAASTGGFFEDEEDETIALTGDELDNILNTAEFTEETGKPTDFDEDNLDTDGFLEASAEIAFETPESPEPDETAAAFEEPPTEEVFAQTQADEVPETPEVQPAQADSGEVSEITLEEIVAEGQEVLNEDPFRGSDEEVRAMAEMDIEKELEGIDDLEDDSLQFDFDEAELEKMSIEIPDSFAEESSFEAAPDGFEPDLTETESEILQESIEEDYEESFPEDTTLGPMVMDAETVDEAETEAAGTDEEPVRNAMGIPAEPATVPEQQPETEQAVPAQQEPEFAAEEREPETAAADESGLSVSLKNEIKSVLAYMDKLLEALPEEKIEEFARSEHFEVYKRLFEELGL